MYEVIVKPSAEKTLFRLPQQGRDGWRVRVGDYRILYTIDDDEQIVAIVAIAHRRDVYR